MLTLNHQLLKPIPSFALRLLYRNVTDYEAKLQAAGLGLELNNVLARALADERRHRVAAARARRRPGSALPPAPPASITIPLMTEEEALAAITELQRIAVLYGQAAREMVVGNAPEDQGECERIAAGYCFAGVFLAAVAEQCLIQLRQLKHDSAAGVVN